MGKISQGESKKFYPNEVVPSPFTREIRITSNPNSTQVQNEIVTGDLLVELKSNSGTVLYSRYFTWDELVASLEGGKITWIGEGK